MIAGIDDGGWLDAVGRKVRFALEPGRIEDPETRLRLVRRMRHAQWQEYEQSRYRAGKVFHASTP
jgi:hypothetical protein